MASGNELAKRAPRWRKKIELFYRKALLSAGAPVIRKFLRQFGFNLLAYRFINPRTDFNVTSVEPHLPGKRGRNDHISADKLAPMHVVAESRRASECGNLAGGRG